MTYYGYYSNVSRGKRNLSLLKRSTVTRNLKGHWSDNEQLSEFEKKFPLHRKSNFGRRSDRIGT